MLEILLLVLNVDGFKVFFLQIYFNTTTQYTQDMRKKFLRKILVWELNQ